MLPSVLKSLIRHMHFMWLQNINLFEVNTHVNLWVQSLKKGMLNSYKYIGIKCIILEMNMLSLKGLTPAVKAWLCWLWSAVTGANKSGLSTRGTSACHVVPRTNRSTNVNKTGKRKKPVCVTVCVLHTRSEGREDSRRTNAKAKHTLYVTLTFV